MAEEKYVSGEEFNALKAKDSSNNNSPPLSMRTILVIAAIIWTITVFFIGVAYQKHHSKSTVAITNTSTNPGGRFGGFGGKFANRTFGTVTAISSTSITVNNPQSNTSSTLTINRSTTVSDNGQTATLSSITVGETVSIQVDSSDKTIASSIMVLNFQGNGSPTGSSTQTN
jgi:hypothetical protein